MFCASYSHDFVCTRSNLNIFLASITNNKLSTSLYSAHKSYVCLFMCHSPDTRVAKWPLMSAYTPTLVLTGLYLFVVWYGQRWMKERSAWEFKWTLFLYNMGLVVLNFHICSEVGYAAVVVLLMHHLDRLDSSLAKTSTFSHYVMNLSSHRANSPSASFWKDSFGSLILITVH